MSFESKSAGPVEIIVCAGQLDINNAPQTRQQLDQLIEDGRNRLIFDLERVTAVDSSGLAVLVNALHKTRAAGGEIALLKPCPEVGTILRLTRLSSIFKVYENEQIAVAEVSG